ncbi:hypothetical protein [Nocardia flavorosea]|nr:hypothetical protein [Nocardia flavorosea]
MNRHGSTNSEIDRVARMRALIERSSLGEEGARQLAQRTSDGQVDRIRRRLQDINHTETATTERPEAEKTTTDEARQPTATVLAARLPRLIGGGGRPNTAESSNHHFYDMMICSKPITLTPQSSSHSSALETYLVLMADSAGACAWIATPTRFASDGEKYRISAILASRDNLSRNEQLVRHSLSVASDCFSRKPSAKEIFTQLNEKYLTELKSASKLSTEGELDGSIPRIEKEDAKGDTSEWIREYYTSRLPFTQQLPHPFALRRSEHSRERNHLESLVIAVNRRGVGLTAELGESTSSYIYNAVQKATPKSGDRLVKATPHLRSELRRIVDLMKPGARVVRSWKEPTDSDITHDLFIMFSEILRNTSGLLPPALDPIIKVHLEEFDSQSQPCVGVIETTWRTSYSEAEEMGPFESDFDNHSPCGQSR